MIQLEPDQMTSLNAVIDTMRQGYKSVLLQGATGSGKSYIASEFVRRAVEKDKIIWYLVPRRDLVRQMHETFGDFGIDHGFIVAGLDTNPFLQTYICSIDTLRNRLDKLKPPHLLIIDETHRGSDGLDKIIQWAKAGGSYIIGLSATPWKLSGKGLGCWYDKMIVGPSIRWLIDNKRLSEYKAFAPDVPDLSNIDITNGDYAKGQLSERMEQDNVLIGNSVKHYKSHAMGTLGVTFGVSRKHSEMLAQAYRDAGIPAIHIDGETPEDERVRIAKAFAKRELLQLCNAELLSFGWDLAQASGIKGVCVQTMTDCQPTMSLAKQRQKNGRALRYDGTLHYIFDHANNIQQHDMPCADIEWSLEDRQKQSRDTSGEKTIPVRICPKCYFACKPTKVCVNCGHEFPIMYREVREKDGELKEIKEVRKKRGMEEYECKTLDDWKELARQRGHKPGWAYVRFKNMKARRK